MKEHSASDRSSRAPWFGPILWFDEAWQRLESRVCAGVLVAEIAALTLWISLKGLSTDFVPGENAAGLAYRCVAMAALLGACAHGLTHKFAPTGDRAATRNRFAVLAAMAVGLVLGRVCAHAGVRWSSNVLNWLQNASALMLVGGLRGLVTRLTLWLAMLGASLAASRGKHIHVDVLVHYLGPRARAATAVAGRLGAAAVCVLGVVGFVDYISIAEYRVSATVPCPGDARNACDASAAEKAAAVEHAISADFFLLGRQLSLDAKSLPKVLAGEPYDQWMTAAEWNQWLDGADWTAHFDRSAVDALRMPAASPEAVRMPQVAVPGTGEEARGVLIRELNFVFPAGLAIIAIKLVLRALLLRVGERAEPDVGVAS